jgi:F0F1-type ATP synthase alpha subunit
MPVEKQVTIIYAVSNGFLDGVDILKVRDYEKNFHAYMEESGKDVLESIRQSGKLEADTVSALENAINAFNAEYAG